MPFPRFGFFYVLPTTAPAIASSPSFAVPQSSITSSPTNPCIVTIGDYNVCHVFALQEENDWKKLGG